ncbi:golgin candidate 2-like protein [Corchorus capsularis]|uniref:Golgin candidate 2-like protein n=1 Tax=Corchorus capsularis TaxID=210143 RepID=A0A1R3K2A7_COCAP|nr:golgin candidate 2-like protein [Corchorus capsularis]
MANWISSKLKVAESLLQQIDQQAAESLKKNEKPSSDEVKLDTPTKTGGVVSLKDQLKKKSQENNDFQGKLFSDRNANLSNNVSSNNDSVRVSNRDKEVSSSKVPSKPKSTLTDSDWTELLSTPSQGTSSRGNNRSNGVSGVRGLRRDASRKKGSLGSNLSVLEGKKNQKSNVNVVKSARRSDIGLGNKLNGKPSDGEESSSSGRPSSVDIQNDGKNVEGLELDHKDTAANLNEENGWQLDSKDLSSDVEGFSQSQKKKHSFEKLLELGKVDRGPDVKIGTANANDQLRTAVRGKSNSISASRSSVADDVKRGSQSTSDGSSDSDSDSGSTSDSESEREREERRRRKERMLAERAAAKAVEAIKERENMVARLEGEKQSLEKILEERAKQQAQEASELQTTMMEMMEAVELEKQKHNNTRMAALQRLAKLETTNADLARSLATAQKKLEVEINQVADIRQQIELKEAAQEELRRRITNNNQSGTYLNQLAASKGIEFEREILEAEYSLITDKIARLQDKARQLEASIELTRKEMEDPTEVEVELKRRLGQLTDHLIQKQAQVESLSSEKATLLFRIEAVSRMLDEGKSMNISDASSSDIESGTWNLPDSKFKPMLEDKIRSGRRQLNSLLCQLDAIFVAGAIFLRRNATAKLWSVVYLVCLHFWVIYILMSHSHATVEERSGAVVSLENINKTGGV